MGKMTVTYHNQKFFLQIEGGQIEIGNPKFIFKEGVWIERKEPFKDGDSFPLPSGIGYRIETIDHDCKCDPNSLCRRDPCEKYQVATLYVIEEEKESELWQTSNPNKEKYLMSSNLVTDGMQKEFIEIWQQIEIWYGDTMCRETAEQLLKRLSSIYKIEKLKK